MKPMKTPIALIAVVIIIGFAVYGISMYQRFNRRGELAERIISISNPGGDAPSYALGNANSNIRSGTQGVPPETIEGLRNAIGAYEKRIEKHVEDAARIGTYWKILAVRLQDRGLHGEALEALEQAVYYSPEDSSLQYSVGISAGIMAKSFHASFGTGGRNQAEYLALAEKAFLRAIELDDRYLRPRYSLGILYVFELERPEEAIPHLEKCLEISRNDVDTMFIMARAFYMTKRYQEAVDLYDRIIILTRDEKKRADARNNRQLVLEQIYG
jgi:tetratricopeptide (TPR) repeat protein